MAKGPEEKEIEQNRADGVSGVRVLSPLCPRTPRIERYPHREPGEDLQPAWPVCEVREFHGGLVLGLDSDCGGNRSVQLELSGCGYDDGNSVYFAHLGAAAVLARDFLRSGAHAAAGPRSGRNGDARNGENSRLACFSEGLATNLHGLGVPDKIIRSRLFFAMQSCPQPVGGS